MKITDNKMLNEIKSRLSADKAGFAGKYVLYLPVLIIGFYLAGCSDLETDINQPPEVSIHKEGILTPSSEDFHGKLVRNNNWDMNLCKECHGINYDGGLVKVSCFTCHNDFKGPENCSTCHGSSLSPAPPRDLSGNVLTSNRGVGAHQVHLAGNSKGKTLSCAECHSVPGSVYQDGHIDTDVSQAEVLMNNYLANLTTNNPSTSNYSSQLPLFEPSPEYDSESLSCSNTYCHGTFKNGNTDNAPVWNDPTTAACGTCHGNPTKATLSEKALPKTSAQGGTHPDVLTCSACHVGVVDANLKFIDASKHIDGKLNLSGSDIAY